jgi:hypothetical protein
LKTHRVWIKLPLKPASLRSKKLIGKHEEKRRAGRVFLIRAAIAEITCFGDAVGNYIIRTLQQSCNNLGTKRD